MKALELHNILIQHAQVDVEKLETVYAQLPDDATVAQYRTLLVKSKLMKYSEIMTLFVTKGLEPRSETLLGRLANKRKNTTTHKPKGHEQKFHITDSEVVNELQITDKRIPVTIPPVTEQQLTFHHSDEKQAIQLALEVAHVDDPAEAEVILLETIESFKNSEATMQCLCWLYLATGHADLVHSWATRNLEHHQDDKLTLELLALAQQKLGKHLLATSHYQKLLQNDKVKSSWYVLLAISQETTQCIQEAIENYKIYLAIGKDPKLRIFAETHLKELNRK